MIGEICDFIYRCIRFIIRVYAPRHAPAWMEITIFVTTIPNHPFNDYCLFIIESVKMGGPQWGSMIKVRRIVQFTLSPFEQKAFAGFVKDGVPRTWRRFSEQVFRIGPRKCTERQCTKVCKLLKTYRENVKLMSIIAHP